MKWNEERRTGNEEVKPSKYFTDLKVWQEGHQLVIAVYRLAKSFPKTESYGLTSQIKRAVVSITSNIAEGFKRESMKDKLHFYIMSHGSLSEVQNQLYIALDVEYITKDKFDVVYGQTEVVDRLLTGLINASKERL